MSRSRRTVLRRSSTLLGGAILGSIAGCSSRSDSSTPVGTDGPPSAVVEDWRREFSTPTMRGPDGVASLAMTDGVVTAAGLTRSSDEESVWASWIRGFDFDGTERWRVRFGPPDQLSDEQRSDQTPSGPGVIGSGNLDGDVVVCTASVRPEYRFESPTLRRLDSGGNVVWSTSLDLTAVEDFTTEQPDEGTHHAYVVGSDPVDDASVRLVAVAADGRVAWDRPIGSSTVQTVTGVQGAPGGGVTVAGRGGQSDGYVTSLRVGSDGTAHWERTFGRDWGLANPNVVFGPDRRLLAVNSITNSFTARTDVARVDESLSVDWKRTIDGWRVVDISRAPSFAPEGGFLLTMTSAGENEGEEPGALFVGMGPGGAVEWSYDGLGQSESIGPGIADALVGPDRLFVGGNTPDRPEGSPEARLVSFLPDDAA